MNKHGWTYKKLGEVAEIVGGSTPKTGKPEYWNGTHFWVTPAELGSSVYIGKTERTITDKAVSETNLTLLPVGTVLLSSRAPIGKTAITTAPMYCNQGFKNIVCSDALNNKFVYHYITHIVPSLQSQGRGATFKEISKSIVEKTKVPVPSMEEQEAIVSELDEINEAIATLKQQVADLDTLAQSTFYTLFGDPVTNEKGWDIQRLGGLADLKNGLNFDKCESNQKIRFLGVSDFQNNFFVNTDDLDYISVEQEVSQDFLLKTNDIVFVRSNGSKRLIGRSVIISTQEPTTYSGFCIRCRIHESHLLPIFLLYIVKNKNIIGYLTNSGRGCNISNINQKILSSTPIILPPLALQQEFTAKVEAIESAKAEINAQIAEMQTLLASRMDYYFD